MSSVCSNIPPLLRTNTYFFLKNLLESETLGSSTSETEITTSQPIIETIIYSPESLTLPLDVNLSTIEKEITSIVSFDSVQVARQEQAAIYSEMQPQAETLIEIEPTL